MVFNDSSENRAIYDNVEKIWYSQTRRINKDTNTHSDYVMFIAFTRKKCTREAPHCYVYKKIAYLLIDTNVYEDCCTPKLHVDNR